LTATRALPKKRNSRVLVENNTKDEEEVCSLKNKVEKRNEYLKNLIKKNKESLRERLPEFSLRDIISIHF